MVVSFSEAHCTACGDCVDLCPGDLIRLDPGAHVPRMVYHDECWFCGACVHGCPEDSAIQLQLPDELRA